MSAPVRVGFALFALALWWGVPAGAATVQCPAVDCDSIGTLGPGAVFSEAHTVPSGLFSDIYNFGVGGSAGTIALGVTNVPLYGFLNIDNLGLALYGALNGGGSLLAANATAYSLSLPAGDYSAVVSGAAVGTSGGVYALAIHAVPLPAPVLLLISGLAALGAAARRKSGQ